MNTYIKTIILWTINSFDRRIWSRKLLPARIGNWNLQSLQFSIKLTLKKHKQFSVVYFEINQTTIFIQSFFWKKRKSLKDILSIKKEQLFANVLQNMCSLKFCSIHRKTPVLESLFNKVASFQEEGKKRLNADVFLTMLQNILWHLLYRTPPVAAPHKKSRTNLNVHTLLPHNLQFQNRRSQ